MRYVVVGSGPAGISAAEEIRKTDPAGPITMITADPHPAYSPVMLTYWMSGHYPKERLFFRDMGSWAADHRVDLRCGETGNGHRRSAAGGDSLPGRGDRL